MWARLNGCADCAPGMAPDHNEVELSRQRANVAITNSQRAGLVRADYGSLQIMDLQKIRERRNESCTFTPAERG